MKLSIEEAEEYVYGGLIYERMLHKSRWSVYCEGVFKHTDGKHYMFHFNKPYSDYQEDQELFNDDEVECYEVELKDVTEKKWCLVEQPH